MRGSRVDFGASVRGRREGLLMDPLLLNTFHAISEVGASRLHWTNLAE